MLVTQASPFLPLMFIASEPHTPSRQLRRNDSVSSLRLEANQRVEQHAVSRLERDVVLCMYGFASFSGS